MSARPVGAKRVVVRPQALRRKLESRERILAEAHRLFARKGFNAVTTAEVAEAADVAKGSVFAQVGSKERLLVLVFERDMNKWLDDAAAHAGTGTLLDQLDRFFEQMLDGAAEIPELTAVFMREMPYAYDEPEIAAVRLRIDTLLAELIDAAKARGEIAKSIDAFTLGRNLFSLYFFFQHVWLASGAPRDRMVPSLRDQLALQLRSVRPR